MYFFYVKETGTSDPEVYAKKNGKTVEKDHLYVLTAVSMHEFHWKGIEKEVTKAKFQLMSQLFKQKKISLTLADCEVKSTWMRIPKERKRKSPFLSELSDEERTALSEVYYSEIEKGRITLHSVIVDKRKLRSFVDQKVLFHRAYTALLEVIESYMEEYYEKHQAVVVLDSGAQALLNAATSNQVNFKTRMYHFANYKHIVEYPFVMDNRVSTGLQLADLCGYNVYRAFREQDFSYPFFQRILPYFFTSKQTDESVVEGLRVWPDDSVLKNVSFTPEVSGNSS